MAKTPVATAFGARLIGQTYPEKPEHGIQLFQLMPDDPADRYWIDRMTRITAHQNDSRHLSPSQSCCHPSVGWQHIRNSWQLLKRAVKHWTVEPPVAVIAVNASRQVVGMCLGHVERQLPGMTRQYTSFPEKGAPVAGLGKHSTHSQIEKLYSNALQPGVGKSLIAGFLQVLPSSVETLHICGMAKSLSAKAQKLYAQIGFAPRPDLLNARLIDDTAPAHRWLDFKQLNTTPMTLDRAVGQQSLDTHLEAVRYKAMDQPASVSTLTLFDPVAAQAPDSNPAIKLDK